MLDFEPVLMPLPQDFAEISQSASKIDFAGDSDNKVKEDNGYFDEIVVTGRGDGGGGGGGGLLGGGSISFFSSVTSLLSFDDLINAMSRDNDGDGTPDSSDDLPTPIVVTGTRGGSNSGLEGDSDSANLAMDGSGLARDIAEFIRGARTALGLSNVILTTVSYLQDAGAYVNEWSPAQIQRFENFNLSGVAPGLVYMINQNGRLSFDVQSNTISGNPPFQISWRANVGPVIDFF